MEPHSPFQRCCHFLSPLGHARDVTRRHSCANAPRTGGPAGGLCNVLRKEKCSRRVCTAVHTVTQTQQSPLNESRKPTRTLQGRPGPTRRTGSHTRDGYWFHLVFQSMPLHSLRIGQGEELGIPKHAARRHRAGTPCLAHPTSASLEESALPRLRPRDPTTPC